MGIFFALALNSESAREMVSLPVPGDKNLEGIATARIQ